MPDYLPSGRSLRCASHTLQPWLQNCPRTCHPRDWVAFGKNYLTSHKIPEAQANAEFLLAHLLTVKRKEIYLAETSLLSREKWGRYRQLLYLRGQRRKPLSYILATQEFMGISFKVVEKITLIPRQETESLVEFTLKKIKEHFETRPSLRLLDIGTGTGCIALSLAYFLKSDYKVSLVLTDISAKALNVARLNARNLLQSRVKFVLGTWPYKERVEDKVDVVVSNPPYVKDDEFKKLPPEIRLWEPREALVGGPDGLKVIREIVKGASRWLKPNGFLALEIDPQQTPQVKDLLVKNSYKDVEIFNDFAYGARS